MIFLDPPDNRILAVTEMEKPKTKKDVQRLCGMISSLKPWFPNINFATKALRGGCASTSKFIWTPEMNLEFEKVKVIFTDQIRLSPFNPFKYGLKILVESFRWILLRIARLKDHPQKWDNSCWKAIVLWIL